MLNSYSLGRQIYNSGNVKELDFRVEESDSNKEIIINSFINSGDINGGYHVNLILNDKKSNLRFKCSCPSFTQYSDLGCCKHVAATLLKFFYENKDLVRGTNESSTDNILNDLFKEDNKHKEVLNLEVTYNKTYNNNLEFRLGTNKLYVVKNIEEFAECIRTEKALIFGKNFTFDLNNQKFKEEDLKIIDFIVEMSDLHGSIGRLTGYWGKSFIKGKNLFLPGQMNSKFFKLVAGSRIKLNYNNEVYNDIEVALEDLPLDIDVNESNKGIQVLLKSENPIQLDESGVFLYKNKIYIISKQQAEIYKVLVKHMKNEKKLVFNNNESEKFATKIVPALNKVSEKLTISESLKSKIVSEKLKTVVFLDREEDNIVAKVEFIYGDFIVNPFKENKSDKFIIRDDIEERKLINHLEDYNFNIKDEKYILSDEENIINYINQGVKNLQNLADVYYSEEFKKVKVYSSPMIRTSLSLNDNQLLEFDFDIPQATKEEIDNIFKSFREKKRFYKLKNGGFLSLDSTQINELNSMMDHLGIGSKNIKDGKFTIPKNFLLYIDETLKESSIEDITKDKPVKELLNNIKEIKEIDYYLNDEISSVMRDYQKIGYNWFKTLSAYGFGGILADEMGLGKTIQTIAFLASELGELPSLVVTPTSLIYNWEREFEKFAPRVKVLVISGDKSLREEQFQNIDNYDVVLTSYPLLTKDIDMYNNVTFKYCIIDEAQKIKNYNTLTSKSVKEVKSLGRFALTGTPIENSLTELWSIFDFIMPGYLFSNRKFAFNYETPILKNNNKSVFHELNKKIKPFILRRKKIDVALELPPKIEQKIYVDLTEEQKKLYMSYVASLKGEIDDEVEEKGFNRSKIKILAALTRLRQICCDPSTFIEDYLGESGKIKALEELLEEILSDGHKVLIFSQFTSVLKNIGNMLTSNNVKYSYLDGSLKSEERIRAIDEFNNGENEVFLISLKAGGTGLNLTSADIVIHFDPWWNPSVEEQASDRAHRIGQNKTVEVIKLISKGTIEEKINLMQERKKEVIKNVLDNDTNEDNVITTMSYDEIQELFKY